ncbi:MAG TPA: 2-hydroxymuconate tautomerase [Synergistaceae bacterium]|jgi:4-oxalocrotonate tautomerase|nr:2-hydroxymuconate tautomerase [Synergistaceae bacterium]
MQEMKNMPIVVVNIKEGRTLEQKRAMVTKVTEALCETMEVPKTSVRIIINEMANDNFAVAGTLVCDNPDAQVKKKS